MTNVVAGILEQNARILICQRRPDQPHALQWEFPGGKVEAGETPQQAIARELREELGIETVDAVELARYEFSYPGNSPILLIFFRIPTWKGEIRNIIFNTIVWETFNRLTTYNFLEGDLPFLSMSAVLL